MTAPGFESPLDLVQRMLFLRDSLPFIRTSASALADLARILVELRFEPGTVLWRRGEPARQVQLLVDGRVSCSAPIEGFGLQPEPGYPLGGLDAVAGVPRWYDAVCEGPVVTLSGDVEALFDLFEDNPRVALVYLAQIAGTHLDALELIAASRASIVAAAVLRGQPGGVTQGIATRLSSIGDWADASNAFSWNR